MCSYMKQKRPGFQYPVKHFAIAYSLWNKNKNNMSKTVSCNIISCCYKKLYCKKQIIISMYSGSHLHILVNSLPSCVVCIIFCPFLLRFCISHDFQNGLGDCRYSIHTLHPKHISSICDNISRNNFLLSRDNSYTSIYLKHRCFLCSDGWMVRMFSFLYFRSLVNKRLSLNTGDSCQKLYLAVNCFGYNVRWSILSKPLALNKWEWDGKSAIQLVNESC